MQSTFSSNKIRSAGLQTTLYHSRTCFSCLWCTL